MPGVSENMRRLAVKKFTEHLKGAAKIPPPEAYGDSAHASTSDADTLLAAYTRAMEAALFAKFGTSGEDYRDQLLGVVANLKDVKDELSAFSAPGDLATMAPSDIMNSATRRKEQRATRKRARELLEHDDTKIMCARCNLVIKNRLNENRFALDDSVLGCQYDNNFADYCACPENNLDELPESFGLARGLSESSSSSSSSSSLGRK